MPSKYKSSSRYPTALLESGAFHFAPDDGCHFIVEISDAGYKLWQSPILNTEEKIFEIEFERKWCEELPDYDDAVCNTLYKIITSNILSKGDLCVFYHVWENDTYCEHFYEHFYDEIEYLLDDFETFHLPALEENGEEIISSLIVHKLHPQKQLIVLEFQKFIEGGS